MKKVLSLIFVTLLPLVANAYDAEIDGIYYNFSGDEATVTYQEYRYKGSPHYISNYSNCVCIPEIITYNGKTFRVISIGEGAFCYCRSLTSVTIPNSVTSIGSYAFSSCTGLTSVTIPDGVTIIGDDAFSGCSGLTSFTIPNSVTSIGIGAFSSCSGLSSITISDGVTTIGDYAFYNCSGLASVTIPQSVNSIGDYVFCYCYGLTSVTIPNSVTSIGERAFYWCNNLTSIIIPENVKSIKNDAFSCCSGLNSIKVEIGNAMYDSRNNCNALIESTTNNLIIGCQNTVIPSNVKSIGNYAFYKCSGLSSITIPNGVTSIGDYAFYNCTGLSSVIIPNSVTSIGERAFSDCYYLNYVSIGKGVSNISSYTFSDCKNLISVVLSEGVQTVQENAFRGSNYLQYVTFPSTIEAIGLYAFTSEYIRDVYCYATGVALTNGNAFNNSALTRATLHVPAASIEYYRTTAPWSRFGTIVKLDNEGQVLEQCATPTISYVNGELIFNCEMEDVQYISTIKDSDIGTNFSDKIKLGMTYTITVYATKAGYENSDVATGTLCWIDVAPQTEGIVNEDAVTEVKAVPVLIQTQGGNITIQGAAEGTPIAIYGIDGKEYGSATSERDRTTIATSLRPGSIAIVKIGEKAVKVLVK